MAQCIDHPDYSKLMLALRTILITDPMLIEVVIGEYDGKLLIALSEKFINDFNTYRRNYISEIISEMNRKP